MCIGAVVTCPGGGGGGSGCVVRLGFFADTGGGGGADRIDCEAGAPDLNFADGGPEPFVFSRGWPSAPNAPESDALGGGGGVPAAGAAAGICDDWRGGGELMIASMLARSGSRASGPWSDSLDCAAFATASASALSLS